MKRQKRGSPSTPFKFRVTCLQGLRVLGGKGTHTRYHGQRYSVCHTSLVLRSSVLEECVCKRELGGGNIRHATTCYYDVRRVTATQRTTLPQPQTTPHYPPVHGVGAEQRPPLFSALIPRVNKPQALSLESTSLGACGQGSWVLVS